jgi:site-specific recombinase XerD
MTIYPELRNRTDKRGMAALRLVVQDGTTRRFVPLPFKIKPTEWDKDRKQVKQNHPHASAINTQIRITIAQMEVDLLQGKEIIKPDKEPFRAYAMECMGRWEHTKSANTIRAYRSMLRQVIRFDPDITLNDLDATWLLRFDAWCRQDGCDDAGTLKRVSFISTVLHEALRYGKIQMNPFMVYRKPKKENPNKIWLTMDELQRVWDMQTNSPALQNVRAWFLLSCYTGLRYSDVAIFDPAKHIQDGRIILYTTKTGEVVSIKISPTMQKILSFLPADPVYSNQKCNQYLKAVAHVCGINKLLTFHTGRHTFGVQCANLGISQEVTSRLLGHSDIRTTSIYYKIVNERIDREMDKWG